MRAFNGLFQKLLIITVTVGLLSACGGKEERKAKYLEKGKAYLAEKNYDKAKVEFKNVLQIDPKSAAGYLYLGKVEEKKQNWAKAFGMYKKASGLAPELIEPRIRLAKFYLAQASALRAADETDRAANTLALAQEQVKEVLKQEPGNLEALSLEATLWVGEGEKDKAVVQLEKVNKQDPGLQSAAILLASVYEQDGRNEDAERVLVQAIKAVSEPVVFQQRLSQFYGRQKENDKVEQVLRDILSSDPEKLGYYMPLATFFSQTDQLDKAEQILRDAIAVAPDDAERYLILAEFLLSRRSKDMAIAELESAIKAKPDMARLKFGLARLYMANEQPDRAKEVFEDIIAQYGVEPDGLKARVVLAQLLASKEADDARVPELIDEVLAENARDNDALLLKGRLAAKNKDYAGAIADFRSVLRDQPDSVEVLQLLAATHLANGEMELARDTLQRAVENNPDNAALRLGLANILVKAEDLDGAIKQLDELLQHDKYNEQALAAKYGLLASKGDTEGLDEVTKLMQAGAPDKEGGFIREARTHFSQGDYDAALAILDKLLEKNPKSVNVLMAKIETLAAQEKYDEAILAAEAIQEIRPDSEEGFYLKGKLSLARGDVDEAIQQYDRALQNAPESGKILAELINAEVRQKAFARAEKRLLKILEKDPEHNSASGLLVLVYASNKDYPAAEAAAMRQIEITPESATAYEVLAQMRASKKNFDSAVSVYKQGLKVLPDNIRLLIGLAGIRERQKDVESAISVYEKVLELKPDNAVAVNNLAALISDHRNDQASLDRAVELAGKLEKTSQPAFLDTAGWVYYRKGDYDKAKEILVRVVEKMPAVPVFQYHLGMLYHKLGDNAAAKAHLVKATADDADYEGVEEARKVLGTL